MKNQRSNDEQITGKLHVAIYAHPTVACPDCNDPTTASSATVVGLDAARAWLEPRGVPCYMRVEEPFEVLSVLVRCRTAMRAP